MKLETQCHSEAIPAEVSVLVPEIIVLNRSIDREMAQKDLYLPFLALSIIACCLMNLQSVLSSSRMRNSTNDISDDKCPPQPHPLGMCRSRVAAYGYPCEEYHVTTEDGYILSLKRIPYGLSGSTEITRTPVLLFHGLLVVRQDRRALSYLFSISPFISICKQCHV